MNKKPSFALHRPRIHYAWLVLFCCCMFFGASMGIFGNCEALYTAEMLADLGWSYTLLTVIGAALTVSRMIGTRFTTAVFRKHRLKPVLSAAVIVMMGSCIAKAFMHSAAVYTVINILLGVSGAFLLYVPVPLLINNWFAEKRETALGIAMLCSGLFAAVLSPVFNAVMVARGWRTACIVNGIVGLAVALPPIWLFAVKTPEEMGLKPYGWKPPEPMKVYTSPSQVFENGNPDYDTRFSVKEKKQKFYLSAVLAMFVCAMSGVPGRLPHFAATCGPGSTAGALMLSVAQAGNMLSKAVMGPLCDRFGPRKTYSASLFIVFLSFLALCFMPSSLKILLPVAFLAGLSAGNNMMIYPSAVRSYSRGEEYAGYIARVSMAMTFFGTPFSLLVSAVFDRTGSYFPVFLIYAALEGVCVLLSLKMFPKETRKSA